MTALKWQRTSVVENLYCDTCGPVALLLLPLPLGAVHCSYQGRRLCFANSNKFLYMLLLLLVVVVSSKIPANQASLKW